MVSLKFGTIASVSETHHASIALIQTLLYLLKFDVLL